MTGEANLAILRSTQTSQGNRTMATEKSTSRLVFKPRTSLGWAWLIAIAALGLVTLVPTLQSAEKIPLPLLLFSAVLGGLIFVGGVALAFWFPTMRYELDDQSLVLRYGPVLKYRVPLAQIANIRRRDLGMTIWSSIRFPGIALFSVPYSDVGNVKMCATAALTRILLIETTGGKYGITPADEAGFVDALKARMKE